MEGRADGGAATLVCLLHPRFAMRGHPAAHFYGHDRSAKTNMHVFFDASSRREKQRGGLDARPLSLHDSVSCTRQPLMAPQQAECRTYVRHGQDKRDTRENSPWLVGLRINTLPLANIVPETRATDLLRPSSTLPAPHIS